MKSIQYALFFILFVMMSCSKGTPPNDPIPNHETFTLESKQVGETRTINVWTPEDYTKTSDSLPVMYMADGGIQEDFPHIANTFAALIQSKKIPPFILVGIENTQRRRDLTGPTTVEKDKEVAPVIGGSEKFRAFIHEELFPEINKRYRTTNEKGILGESLSGLFVMETFFLKPEMFDYYIAFDPSLWWNDHYLVQTAHEHLSQFPKEEKVLWFAGSSATDISQYTNQLSKILTEEKPSTLKWHYSDEPKEQHNTIFRATKEKAIIWALNRGK
jgi:predicted alpha/beta superfamily hydrolase